MVQCGNCANTLPLAPSGGTLKYVMLHERTQPQRPPILRIHFYKMPRIGKPIDTKSKLLVARDTEGGKWGMIPHEVQSFLLE